VSGFVSMCIIFVCARVFEFVGVCVCVCIAVVPAFAMLSFALPCRRPITTLQHTELVRSDWCVFVSSGMSESFRRALFVANPGRSSHVFESSFLPLEFRHWYRPVGAVPAFPPGQPQRRPGSGPRPAWAGLGPCRAAY
jgi:hypothetical protein